MRTRCKCPDCNNQLQYSSISKKMWCWNCEKFMNVDGFKHFFKINTKLEEELKKRF